MIGTVSVTVRITRGNLIAAGVVVLLVVPAMFTSCLTHVAPGGIGFTAPLVCPAGSHMRFHTARVHSGGRVRDSDEAFCVDAGGHDLGGNVYPQSFGIVFGGAFLLWGAALAGIVLSRRKAAPTA